MSPVVLGEKKFRILIFCIFEKQVTSQSTCRNVANYCFVEIHILVDRKDRSTSAEVLFDSVR